MNLLNSVSHERKGRILEAIMNDEKLSANAAGNLLLGAELRVHRLGFGAMRLTGQGIWGPPKDRNAALAVDAAPWNLASILSIPRILMVRT